jgi:hypothetical protein
METSFQARYNGLCVPCGRSIEKGEWVVRSKGHGYTHEECRDPEADHTAYSNEDEEDTTPRASLRSVMPRGKTVADRCDRCFMIHASGQTDCQ